ncbi:hypothetical protein [Cytobacillus massiliigabonensis]|uniref:hypothetical protein n=1 Tax=Cytobacillus massiliigabonensis TaxID=1871011 RepID=UPI000C8668A7|nr:hypothetical protein [Cytobacillus massiliigabonensis]
MFGNLSKFYLHVLRTSRVQIVKNEGNQLEGIVKYDFYPHIGLYHVSQYLFYAQKISMIELYTTSLFAVLFAILTDLYWYFTIDVVWGWMIVLLGGKPLQI